MKIFVLSVNGKEFEIGDNNNTPDEILETALELVSYIKKSKKFVYNISKRLYTSELDQKLEKLFNKGDKLELTEKIFIKRKSLKQYNKGA